MRQRRSTPAPQDQNPVIAEFRGAGAGKNGRAAAEKRRKAAAGKGIGAAEQGRRRYRQLLAHRLRSFRAVRRCVDGPRRELALAQRIICGRNNMKDLNIRAMPREPVPSAKMLIEEFQT
jgi:hypothetical protein